MNKDKEKIVFILILLLAFFLRFFHLGENPPSLYWDETSLGYNAYTIATSARDEHGEFLPLARFIAFGDYKPPGYIYATVPSIWLFGLNELSIRLPSAISGFLMVLITYLLVKELFRNNKIALLASFMVAVSPWAVHFSRAAFEANLAAFFNLLAIYLFFVSFRKSWTILPSVVFFILSFYTFNANRIIAPLLLTGLIMLITVRGIMASTPFQPATSEEIRSMLSRRTLLSVFYRLKWIFLSIVVAVLLIAPSISYLRSRESRIRFQEVSIFNNLEPIKLSNQRIALDNNSLWARILHNRRVLFTTDFLKHYFDNFSLRFLFTHGDVNPRLAVQNMGQLYVWSLPFLLIGISTMIKNRERALLPILLWMAIVPIPAGMAKETPHALRIISILPTYQIIIGYGVYQFVKVVKSKFTSSSFTSGGLAHLLATLRGVTFKKKLISISSTIGGAPSGHPRGVFDAYYLLLSVICFLLSVNMFYYLHDYYIHFPYDWSGEWQYGYRQMVNFVSQVEDEYDHIFVTEAQERPYIYFAFYKQIPVDEFLALRKADRDWFGFWHVEALGKIKFNFEDLNKAKGRILLVTTPDNLPSNYRKLREVRNLAGDVVFLIGEKI